MTPSKKTRSTADTKESVDQQDSFQKLEDILQRLAAFGKQEGIKRARVRLGDLEAEIELPCGSREGGTNRPTDPRLDPSSESFQDDNTNDSLNGSLAQMEKDPRFKIIRSPLVGTYYHAPAPGADPFVQVGEQIRKGQPIGIVEAMKLFNEIESEYDGTVVKVIAENDTPVEYHQPLLVLSV